MSEGKATNFLEKFKGRTQQLSTDEVQGILGKNSKANTAAKSTSLSLYSNSTQSASPTKRMVESSSLPKIQQSKKFEANPHQTAQTSAKKNQKKTTQNPFLVKNEFYLDEEEKTQILKRNREEEVRERKENERRKRMAIERKMKESMQNSKVSELIKDKKWVRLGGLGPDLGGEQWTLKKNLSDRMKKFSDLTKQNNMEHLQKLKQHHKLKGSKKRLEVQKDPRSKAIDYSKTVPRPACYSLEKSSYIYPPGMKNNSEIIARRKPSAQNVEDDSEFSHLGQFESPMAKSNQISRDFNMGELESRHKELKSLIKQRNF